MAVFVPTLGESIHDATIARWIKKAGGAVAADASNVERETDKGVSDTQLTLPKTPSV